MAVLTTHPILAVLPSSCPQRQCVCVCVGGGGRAADVTSFAGGSGRLGIYVKNVTCLGPEGRSLLIWRHFKAGNVSEPGHLPWHGSPLPPSSQKCNKCNMLGPRGDVRFDLAAFHSKQRLGARL